MLAITQRDVKHRLAGYGLEDKIDTETQIRV